MNNKKYYVTLLGSFSITHENTTVSDQMNRSKKLWNLIEYVLANRGRNISQDELLELIWADNLTDNSPGALKVLLHRARKLIEDLNPSPKEELIVLSKGSYFWNPSAVVVTDTDQFTEAFNKAEKESDIDKKIVLYEKVTELYKGEYLSGNSANWVIPYAEYYHDIYTSSVFTLIDCYYETQRFESIISLCEKALKFDEHNEKLYFHLINSLYKSGHQTEALIKYSEVTETFYRQFAINPSEELKALYRTIIKTTKALETDLDVIKEALTEEGEAVGAFRCEYEFFKDIYQLEARACARSGDSIYLGLITLSSSSDERLSSKSINKAMDDLTWAINETLRKGDVYSRYSLSQYVLLLPSASYENIEAVMKRISSSFFKKHVKKDVGLSYKMQPLVPKA